jgi:tRNA (guanine6-N2)-methyltransferase
VLVLVVLEVLRGIEQTTVAEVGRILPGAVVQSVGESEIGVQTEGLDGLQSLRTVVAAYLALPFDIRRPKELLSSDRFGSVIEAVEQIRRQRPKVRFASFRVSAAGSDSEVMTRFRADFAEATRLVESAEDGELLVRVRRTPDGPGWQVLLRTTPRPLSARAWRAVNYPGAVNATVAAAVVEALDPRPADLVIDLMCGSGTLVLERLARCRPERLVASDVSADALDAAQQNQRASRLKGRVEYLQQDVRTLQVSPAGFTTLMANPPWGELVGSHDANEDLYPALLHTAHRLAADHAVLGVLTHDIRRFERILASQKHWVEESQTLFFQKGHHPRLYVLRHR